MMSMTRSDLFGQSRHACCRRAGAGQQIREDDVGSDDEADSVGDEKRSPIAEGRSALRPGAFYEVGWLVGLEEGSRKSEDHL
jgi:hypothetical protein